jgi:hypothetical protein
MNQFTVTKSTYLVEEIAYSSCMEELIANFWMQRSGWLSVMSARPFLSTTTVTCPVKATHDQLLSRSYLDFSPVADLCSLQTYSSSSSSYSWFLLSLSSSSCLFLISSLSSSSCFWSGLKRKIVRLPLRLECKRLRVERNTVRILLSLERKSTTLIE